MSRSVVATLLFVCARTTDAAVENVTATVECPGQNLTNCAPLATCVPTILESTPAWKGACEGLTKQPGSFTAATCKIACMEQVNCSVWQFSNFDDGVKSTTTPPATFCYLGIPKANCRTRAGFEAIGGERVQRGAVIPTKSTVGMEITGLHSFTMDTGTAAEKKKRCMDECYTNVHCGVWQFTNADTCHVEKYGNKADDTVKTGTAFAASVIAGEMITHYCPTADPAPESSTPWGWIIAGILAGLALLGLAAYLLQPQAKTKKTRAVKIAPPKEDPPPMYTPVYTFQPTYTLVQQAPPQPMIQPVSYVQETVPMLAPSAAPTMATGGSVVMPYV